MASVRYLAVSLVAMILLLMAGDQAWTQPSGPTYQNLIVQGNIYASGLPSGSSTTAVCRGPGGQLVTGSIGCGAGTIATQNSNSVNITGGSVTGLPTPVNPSDATTKSYVDSSSHAPVTAVNVCSTASCSGQTTTGSITAGTNTLTLASAIDFGTNQNCIGGGGATCTIVVAGAGESIGASGYNIGPPTSLAVASYCSGFTVTGSTVNGSKIIQGITSISMLFGPQAGNSIVGAGIPGGTIITSLSNDPPQLRISNAATATSVGTVNFTASDPCVTTTRFYRVASYGPTLSLGQPVAAVSTSGAVTPNWWNPDGITFNRPAGNPPSGYVIWLSTDGGTTYHFWQIVNIEGVTGAPPQNILNGGPQPIGNVGKAIRPTVPWWIPDNPSTIPSGGLAGYLSTNIVSGGGSTIVTLANNATTTTSSTRVQHDDSAAWAAWGTAINGNSGIIPGRANGGPVVINTSSQALVSLPETTIKADPAALIEMFGDVNQGYSADYAVLVNGGTYPTLSSYVPPLYQNFQEGSHCIPLTTTAGLSRGQFLAIQQGAPAGPTQALPYFYGSVIRDLTCNNNQVGVDMVDTTPVTFWSAGTNPTGTQIQGSGTVTISGTLAPGDVLTVSASGFGPFSGAATYTVQAGDSLTTAARGLALAVDKVFGPQGEFAFHSLGIVTLVTPTVDQDTIWSVGTTGAETLTVGTGTGFGVYTWIPVTNVTVDGLTIVATNAAPWALGDIVVPLGVFNTNVSNIRNLHIVDVKLGAAFFSDISYRQTADNFAISEGAEGDTNSSSFSDVEFALATKGQLSNITSMNSSSFGPQITQSSNMQVSNLSQSVSQSGRGIKISAVAGSQFTNIDSENSSNKNVSICCGSHNNSFSGVSGTGGTQINAMGIGGCFDDWVTNNRFTNIRTVGNYQYDICSDPADNHNQWTNVTVGSNANPTTGIFPGIQNYSDLFTNINGCDEAFGDANGHVVCGQPAMRVYANANQSVTSATLTTVAFGTVAGDIGQYWNLGSNQYQPLVPGVYHACLSVGGQAAPWAGTVSDFQMYLIKDSGQIIESVHSPAATSSTDFMSGCANISMNGTTDFLFAEVILSGTSPAILGDPAARLTQLSVNRVGPLGSALSN